MFTPNQQSSSANSQIMDDTIQPSDEEYHATYVASLRLWSELRHQINTRPTLPPWALTLGSTLPRAPTFPSNLKLQHAKYRTHSQAYVTGFSEWVSSSPGCHHGMANFRRPVEITVSATAPISLSISKCTDGVDDYKHWFRRSDENYLTLLVLAWTYILSARWTELMLAECYISYTDCQAAVIDTVSNDSGPLPIEVDLEASDTRETRWWAAVLAPGRGWQATMNIGDDVLFAPWSICVGDSPKFALRVKQNTPQPQTCSVQTKAVTFSDAVQFLDKFCQLHGIEDQSLAALSAVLLLPFQRGNKHLSLPSPVIHPPTSKGSTDHTSPIRNEGHPLQCGQTRQPFLYQELDRLLTFSCYTRSISSLLLSVFFEQGVECNKAGPWLQGAMDALVSAKESSVLSIIFMHRLPAAAPLWLGATILGLGEKLMTQAAYGQIPVDLSAAAWSDTVQSFIQKPALGVFGSRASISRADECRLLFLSQAENHSRVPICPWAPFGSTPIEDTEIEVRLHKDCQAHVLKYEAFVWNCVEGECRLEPPAAIPCDGVENIPTNFNSDALVMDIPNPDDLDHTKEFISQSATQSIFGWLRWYGFAAHEKKLRDHDWLEMVGYKSESEEEIEEHSPKPWSPSQVSLWLEKLDGSSSDISEPVDIDGTQ